jgi:hypothetical protein
MLVSDLQRLDGKTVLVRSADNARNPPVAVRGWIQVLNTTGAGGAQPAVEIVLEFPDMFNEPAHERVIRLDETAIDRLLTSERNGAFEFVVEGPLDFPSANPHRVDPDSIHIAR